MQNAVAVGVIVWSVQGCAPTFRTVESVAAEVHHDEVAAAVKMRDEEIGLEGQVKSKGLKTESEARKAEVVVLTPRTDAAQAFQKQVNVGYLELASTSRTRRGHALCLFESQALDRLATVREGQTVRLTCQFSNIDGERSDRFPVFHNCWIED
jgi:hypothetical protein